MRVIEKTIGKQFEAGVLPEPKEICTKQLYRVIDELERTEVDDNQIAPFLPEVYRKLEWLSKEDVIKRVVSREFGRFLQYYASAPEIQQPKAGRERADKGDSTRKSTARQHRNGSHQPEPGYARLFINFGKRDNFYAREIINLVNRYVKGNVDIGRIDLTANCSFFEVPEADAEYVMRKMAKAKVGDRRVVVDSADRQGESADRQRPNRAARRAERFGGQRHEDYSQRKGGRKGGRYADADQFEKPGRDNDWRQFFDK